MRIEAVIHGLLAAALTVWVDDGLPIAMIVPEDGIGDSSSVCNCHDDGGDTLLRRLLF